jgi:hypothetical protein
MACGIHSVVAVGAFWLRSVWYLLKILIGTTPCTRSHQKIAEGIGFNKPISFIHWFNGIIATLNKTPVPPHKSRV